MKHGRPGNPNIPQTSPEIRSAIVARYLSGFSLEASAKPFGFGIKAAQTALRKAGVPVRSHEESQPQIAVDHTFFTSIDSDKKAYWIGFLSADGCVYRDQVVTTLAGCDQSHLEKFARDIRYAGRVRRFVRHYSDGSPDREYCTLQFTSRQIVADLIRVGVTPRKSLTLQPWNGPAELMPAYFRGLMDGDGHYGINQRGSRTEPQIRLVGSKGVVSAFADFARHHCGNRPAVSPHRNIWQVGIGKARTIQFLCRLMYNGAEVWLDRKRKTVDRILEMKWGNCDPLSRFQPEDLIRRLIRSRDWSDVARGLDMNPANLRVVRRSLGMSRLWKGIESTRKAKIHID